MAEGKIFAGIRQVHGVVVHQQAMDDLSTKPNLTSGPANFPVQQVGVCKSDNGTK